MRSSFKAISKVEKILILQNVFYKVKKENPLRESLRNLLTDAITPDSIIVEIISYFYENSFPLSPDESREMLLKNNWLRQAGLITIPQPRFPLSIQKVSSVSIKYINDYIDVTSAFLGKSLSPKMTSEDFISSIKDIVEIRRISQKRFKKTLIPIEITNSRTDNLWVTWNEKNLDELPHINKYYNEKDYIFKALGLGFHIGKPMNQYVAIIFDLSESEIQLYRPGWGDANTYYYWDSIKDLNAKHGYTKAIDMDPTHNQPEAIGESQHFHLDLISKHSFFLT